MSTTGTKVYLANLFLLTIFNVSSFCFLFVTLLLAVGGSGQRRIDLVKTPKRANCSGHLLRTGGAHLSTTLSTVFFVPINQTDHSLLQRNYKDTDCLKKTKDEPGAARTEWKNQTQTPLDNRLLKTFSPVLLIPTDTDSGQNSNSAVSG